MILGYNIRYIFSCHTWEKIHYQIWFVNFFLNLQYILLFLGEYSCFELLGYLGPLFQGHGTFSLLTSVLLCLLVPLTSSSSYSNRSVGTWRYPSVWDKIKNLPWAMSLIIFQSHFCKDVPEMTKTTNILFYYISSNLEYERTFNRNIYKHRLQAMCFHWMY